MVVLHTEYPYSLVKRKVHPFEFYGFMYKDIQKKVAETEIFGSYNAQRHVWRKPRWKMMMGCSWVHRVFHHTLSPGWPGWGWSSLCVPAELGHGSPLIIHSHLEAFCSLCSTSDGVSSGSPSAPAHLVPGAFPFECLFPWHSQFYQRKLFWDLR